MKTINDIIKASEERFDEKIQERILNEDNPQYVLGWNACRYLSKSFLRTELVSAIKSAFESCDQERELPKTEDEMAWCNGFNTSVNIRKATEKEFMGKE
jgi:hypothetical protein